MAQQAAGRRSGLDQRLRARSRLVWQRLCAAVLHLQRASLLLRSASCFVKLTSCCMLWFQRYRCRHSRI